MARRKRKQTLFDVMNKGSGFTPPTYATRAPRPGSAYTPPKQKTSISSVIAEWLQEKLQAHRAASAERARLREASRPAERAAPAARSSSQTSSGNSTRSGRDELDAMRRELGAKPASRPEPEVAAAVTALVEPEPEFMAPAAPRRSALDALAAMRAELATTVEEETSSAATEVVDGVEEETREEVRPKRKGTIITSIFRSKSRPVVERIETPVADATPTRAVEQQITISSTAGADVREKLSIAQRFAPAIAWTKRTTGVAMSKVREVSRAIARRLTQLLDRMTTQNGHRVALGRYTPFIVGGAVVFVVVLAFAIGQVFRPRAPTALDIAAAEAAKGVTRPDVIRPDGIGGTRTRAGEPGPVVIDDGAKSNVPANIANPPATPTLVRRWNDQQTAGENYIVVMSYTSESDAVATVEVLAKYGIGATVEPNIPRYHGEGQPDRYYVVTTDGFASRGAYTAKVNGVNVERQFRELAKNPGYAALMQQITRCNDAELRKTLPARLDPRPYKWDARPKRSN